MKEFQKAVPVILFVLVSVSGFSQSKYIRSKVAADNSTFLEFYSKKNILIRSLEIDKLNPYRSLQFRAISDRPGFKRFKIEESERSYLINAFFLGHKISPELLTEIVPLALETESSVDIQGDYAVVTHHIRMLDGASIVALKSKLTIYDKKGDEASSLAESIDGYFEPAITDDGKFVGVNYGDGRETGPSTGFCSMSSSRLFSFQSITSFNAC